DGERLAFGAALWEDGRQQEPFAEPRPQGLTYTVARSGERIIIPDVNRHPLFRDYQWGGAVVGLPLRIGERVVGVMNVSFERPHAFDESELRVLELLADQAAIAIENARLYEDVRRRAEEAAALLSTARAISSLELEAVLETIASQAKTLFKADGSRIHLLEPDGETLRCVVALHQRAEAVMAVSLKVGQGITGRVALSGLPEVVPNTLADPRSIQVPGTPVEAEAMALTPLKVRERVIGVMTVSRLGEDRPFTPPDLTFLTAFANQAAVVIENAHLYETVQQELAERQRAEEELRQRQLQLSVLNRMGRALAGTFELVRIYRIAYEHVAQLVDCPSFGISLYDPPTLTLRAEFMLDNGELIDAARFPPLVMDMEPTQGRVRAIATRQPEIITDYPSVAEKATVAAVRVGVSRDEHVTGAAMYVPMVARDQVIGLLEVQSYRLNAYGLEEAALLGPVANQIGLSIQNAQLYEEAQRELAERKRAEGELRRTLEKLREALGGIIQTVALAVETKDPYTAGHQRRVANLARAIANEMGLPQEQIDGVRMAGRIHDLGKIAIPAEILSTPIRLNDFQWGMIKAHSQVGYDILKTVEFPWPVAQIVLQHHERLDGSGYPQGLSGDEIMLEARILAVADVVEAMASFRPYRPTLGIDKALEEISQNRGILYDAEVVDACLKLFAEKGFKFE
ncbi:MAG: GAF domain-containing protein, partial [Anaerolineae bacterium]